MNWDAAAESAEAARDAAAVSATAAQSAASIARGATGTKDMSILDELFATANNTAQGAAKGATNAWGSGAGTPSPSLPNAVTAPLEQAGEAFGRGAAKGAGPLGQAQQLLNSIPAPLQIAGGALIAFAAGVAIFARKGR